MKYIQHIIIGFILILGNTAYGQSITLNACHPFFEDQNFVLQNVGTDATGRNIFETTPVSGDQPCSGLGVCELKLSWNDVNGRWELIGDDGDGDFATKFLIYSNISASIPNPPSLVLGIWGEDLATTGGACGGDGGSSIMLMTGDVQDDLTVLGLQDYSLLSKVNIYPNPSSAFINIDGPGILKAVEIFDITGKLILKLQDGKREIAVGHLNSGMYITKMRINETVIIKRLLVN